VYAENDLLKKHTDLDLMTYYLDFHCDLRLLHLILALLVMGCHLPAESNKHTVGNLSMKTYSREKHYCN
jgi:hypothetical protein